MDQGFVVLDFLGRAWFSSGVGLSALCQYHRPTACLFMEGVLTLRDIVFWLVGCLALYLAWLCFRLFRLRKTNAAEVAGKHAAEFSSETIHSQILGGDSERSFSSVHFDGGVHPEFAPGEEERSEPRLHRMPEPDAGAFGFDALLEVRQSRHLLDELRASHERMRERIEALSEELKELRAACQVAPVYSDAVVLARRGYDAEAIAERCGISIAEAQLVCSLSTEAKGEGAHD